MTEKVVYGLTSLSRQAASAKVLHDFVRDYWGIENGLHRRRDVTFRAVNTDDKSEILLMIPNFNFDWQTAYRWEYGKQRLAKGTRLECVAHYDNSAFNPFNPDPKATIRDGQQTSAEMMNAFFYYVRDGETLGLTVDGATGRLKSK